MGNFEANPKELWIQIKLIKNPKFRLITNCTNTTTHHAPRSGEVGVRQEVKDGEGCVVGPAPMRGEHSALLPSLA